MKSSPISIPQEMADTVMGWGTVIVNVTPSDRRAEVIEALRGAAIAADRPFLEYPVERDIRDSNALYYHPCACHSWLALRSMIVSTLPLNLSGGVLNVDFSENNEWKIGYFEAPDCVVSTFDENPAPRFFSSPGAQEKVVSREWLKQQIAAHGDERGIDDAEGPF